MTREELARKIRWPWIIWTAGLINVVAMLPQLVRIVQTGNVEGLSVEMFVLYFLIQCAFTAEGYFTRNRMFMVCLGLSSVVSAMIITLVVYYRFTKYIF